MRNPYTPLSEEERVKKEDRQAKARKAREDAIAAARHCLGLEDFQAYKKKYEIAKKQTIHYLLELREPDPIKYAFEAQRLLNNLRSIGTLVNQVEKEAGSESSEH